VNWSSAATALGRLLRVTDAAGAAALKADPALMQSITFEQIVRGVGIAKALPWPDMLLVLEGHFSDPERTVLTIEEVLQVLAPFIPGVIPFEEAARVIAVLCKLNVIQTQHGATPPIFGSDGPQYQPAPFI
jgi:hypothetical protein